MEALRLYKLGMGNIRTRPQIKLNPTKLAFGDPSKIRYVTNPQIKVDPRIKEKKLALSQDPCICADTPDLGPRLTTVDAFKQHLFADFITLDSAIKTNSVSDKANAISARELLRDMINSEWSEADVKRFGDLEVDDLSQLMGLAGMGFLKKFRKWVGKTASNVGKAVVKGAKVAAKAVHKVVTLPVRAISEGMLRSVGKGAGMLFLYAFASPKIREAYPKVNEKARKHEKVINTIADIMAMKRSHLMKLLADGVRKKHGQTPEQIIADRVQGLRGMGIPAFLPLVAKAVASGAASAAGGQAKTKLLTPELISRILATISKLIPGIASIFKPADAPTDADFATVNRSAEPFTEEELEVYRNNGVGSESKFMRFLKSPAGIITTIAILGGGGYGIYRATA